MAAIDKTYTNSFKKYKDYLNWAKDKVFICPNGQKLYPINYIYDFWKKEDFEGGKWHPIMNTSTSIDYFLIKNCPFDFVQEQLKDAYGEDYYNNIKNGTSKYDIFSKEGKYGTHFKMIASPQYKKLNKPFSPTHWHVQLREPEGFSLWYNEDMNKWIWDAELGDGHSNTCSKCKTIKSVKRHIRKWKLPKGTIVEVFSRHIGIGYKFRIK